MGVEAAPMGVELIAEEAMLELGRVKGLRVLPWGRGEAL